MFYTLIAMAVLAFLTHVAFLVASFPAGRISRTRYLLSHAALWLTGLLVFLLTVLYAGTGHSEFIDYFDTLGKKMLILVATVLLSTLAHTIVKLLMSRNHRPSSK